MTEDKVTQNGATRPRAGSKTRLAWDTFSALATTLDRAPTRAEALDAATAKGVAKATAATQYSHWKKFNGISGRVVDPSAPAAAPRADKPANGKPSALEVTRPPQAPQGATNVVPMVGPPNGASGHEHPSITPPEELAQDTRLHDEGWDAFCEGKSDSDCPYAAQSADWVIWCEGYKAASKS